MKIPVYNLDGETKGTIDLPDTIFGKKWNPDLVYQAFQAQMSNRRKPLAHVKGRGEVRGGGRKPWRQKGTGRARHGSIRSPLWRGGGVTHGPSSEKVFEKKINKKMKRAALFSLLSKKLADHELMIIDSLKLVSYKTKELAAKLQKFFKKPPGVKNLSALLVPAPGTKEIWRASANIPNVKALNAASISVEDLLKYKNVLIDKDAVPEIK